MKREKPTEVWALEMAIKFRVENEGIKDYPMDTRADLVVRDAQVFYGFLRDPSNFKT